MIEADLGKEALKAESPLGCGPALALIVVDDEDAVGRPAEFGGPVGEGVLTVGRFPVLGHLLGGGLADVNDGQAVEVPGLDLGRESESDAWRSILDAMGGCGVNVAHDAPPDG